jgi:hypothetical protein
MFYQAKESYWSAIIFSEEPKTRRTRALAEMMHTNTVLHTIELLASERNNQIYTEELRPYLVTNLYRPRVHAIKKTEDRPFHEKVLGREKQPQPCLDASV